MTWPHNLAIALWRRLLLITQGSAAGIALAGVALRAATNGNGPVSARFAAAFASPIAQRRVFALLRLIAPILSLRTQLITAYDNSGTTIVSRRVDVIDLLSRDADFEVVYAPRMKMITGGENFFLGMPDSPRYTRDVSNMRLVVRRDDVSDLIVPLVAEAAEARVIASGGRIDVPQALSLPVAAMLLDRYFGTPGPSQADIVAWTTTLFWYLFIDLKADPALEANASATAIVFREWLDGHIAARKASGERRDDVLGRCLEMQAAGLPGMDDRSIRDNLIGLLIGELPTTSAAANLALDELLDRPDALRSAQAAARADDDDVLAAHVFEALRFRPLNPVIYRRATRDAVLATGTLRRRRVRAGSMLLASNLSAMFDPLVVPQPNRFRTDRPWETYILWGYGLHRCFGAHLNRATIPGILKPLLVHPSLRRLDGSVGRIDQQGTPFPVHFHLAFDD